MKFVRNGKEIEVKDSSKVLMVDEVLPILMRYPAKIQKLVLQQLAPYEITIDLEHD